MCHNDDDDDCMQCVRFNDCHWYGCFDSSQVRIMAVGVCDGDGDGHDDDAMVALYAVKHHHVDDGKLVQIYE